MQYTESRAQCTVYTHTHGSVTSSIHHPASKNASKEAIYKKNDIGIPLFVL
jgi:hypothetical protein